MQILWLRKSRWDSGKNQVTLYTTAGDRYVFSLSSGEITTKDRLSPGEDPEAKNLTPPKTDSYSTGSTPSNSAGKTPSPSTPGEKSSEETPEIPPGSSSNSLPFFLLVLLLLLLGGGFWYSKKRK